jgi:hypothetical protein
LLLIALPRVQKAKVLAQITLLLGVCVRIYTVAEPAQPTDQSKVISQREEQPQLLLLRANRKKAVARMRKRSFEHSMNVCVCVF